MDWIEAAGIGTIYTFAITRRGAGAYAQAGPYVLAYVELDEGPRIMTNIVDADLEKLAIGDRGLGRVPRHRQGRRAAPLRPRRLNRAPRRRPLLRTTDPRSSSPLVTLTGLPRQAAANLGARRPGRRAPKHSANGRIDLTYSGARWSGPLAFAEVKVTPADIDYASIYDSFTITVV